MKRRFTDEQIIRTLQEVGMAGNVRGVCRQDNITQQTYHWWRNKFGGVNVSDVRGLQALERENTALKRLVGELSLDNCMLRDVLGKK